MANQYFTCTLHAWREGATLYAYMTYARNDGATYFYQDTELPAPTMNLGGTVYTDTAFKNALASGINVGPGGYNTTTFSRAVTGTGTRTVTWTCGAGLRNDFQGTWSVDVGGFPGVETPPDTPTKSAVAVYGSVNGLTKKVTKLYGGIDTIHNAELKGDTFQQTYTGKNLAQLVNRERTINGVTFTPNADGSVTVNGTATAATSYPITSDTTSVGRPIQLDAGTYTVSGNATASDGFYAQCAYQVPGSSVAYSSKTFNIESSATAGVYIRVTNGVTINNFKFYAQLEKGSTATTYEPYVGGIPSPNPDYPQDIQVVTGDQTVKVTGKNLINQVETNKSVTSSGGISAGNTAYLGIEDAVPCEPNTTYAVSFEHDVSGVNLYVGFWDENGNFIARTGFSTNRTFTTPNNAHSLFFYLNRSGVTFPTIGGWVQLELGSTVTAYEPYQSQTYPLSLGSLELAKIGTYQDYIWKDGSDWKIHKEVGKAVYVGQNNESWSIQQTNPTTIYYQAGAQVLRPTEVNVLPLALSDNFTVYTGSALYNSDHSGFAISLSGYLRINMLKTVAPDVNTLKTWLGTHNTTVYYALATPTDTAIADETLISQLGALEGAVAPSKIPNVTVVGSLPAVVTFDVDELSKKIVKLYGSANGLAKLIYEG